MISVTRILFLLLTILLFSCKEENKKFNGEFFIHQLSWTWDDRDSTLSNYGTYDVLYRLSDNKLFWQKTITTDYDNTILPMEFGLKDDLEIDSFLNWVEFHKKYQEIVDRMIESIPEENKTADFYNLIENAVSNDTLIVDQNTKDVQLFLWAQSYLMNKGDFSEWKVENKSTNVSVLSSMKEIPNTYISEYGSKFTEVKIEPEAYKSTIKIEFAVNKKLKEVIFISEIREITYLDKRIGRHEMYISNYKDMDVLYEIKKQ